MTDTLAGSLRDELVAIFGPIATVNTPAGFRAMLESFGHTDRMAEEGGLLSTLQQCATLVDELSRIEEAELAEWKGIAALLQTSARGFVALRAIEQTISDPAMLAESKDFGAKLINRLIALHLRMRHPRIHRAASLLTLIAPVETATSSPLVVREGRIVRMSWADDRIQFERVGELIRQPWTTLRDAYFINSLARADDAYASADRLLPVVGLLADTLGLRSYRDLFVLAPSAPSDHEPSFADHFSAAPAEDGEPAARDPMALRLLRMPRLTTILPGSDGLQKLAITMTVSSVEHEGGIAGVICAADGALTWSQTHGNWQVGFQSDATVPAFIIEPTGLRLAPLNTPTNGATGRFAVTSNDDEGRAWLLGSAKGTRLEFGKAQVGVDFVLSPARQSIELTMAAKQALLAIVAADGDSFLARVLPADGLRAEFDLSLGLSSDRGVTFGGAGSLDAILPIGLSIGSVLTVPTIHLSLRAGEDGLTAEVSASVGAAIGPLRVLIERVGIATSVTFPKDGGNLGVADLDVRFKPPTGIGLAIDAKVISGSGYLEAFPERGEYLGFAQLTLKSKIAVNAYGVILTKPQVSFLLVISADFPPIQLGLGFRLIGVGGIVGIHRRLDGQRLLDGLRDNLLDAVLFPQNPMKDPHGLVSNVATLFPPSEGEHVFGPTALVTWGPRELIRIKVALVLEFPAFRISTFGVLQARVSKRVAGKDLLVLELQVNFAGMFDFEERFIRFDASLYQSRLLGLTLDGEMAWRLRYGGSSPDLVMTLGGFHPAFQPPALALPASLRRLQLTLASGNPHIWVDAYFAVTSNTLQFGAAGHLRFNKWGVGISGDLGFDALFQFIPFRFEAGVFFLLNASWKGVDFTSIEITGTFSGPSPWRVKGEFKLKICWFLKISVPIDESWGDSDESTLGEVEILPLLVEDVGSVRNWERAPGQTSLLVTCRATQAAVEELMLHPNDLLAVRQNTVPLGLHIDKFGERRPKDATRFGIKLKRGGELVEGLPLRTHFAPAQFFERNEEERLSANSYEFLEAGAGFDDLDAVVFEAWTTQAVTYESEYVDDPSLTPADTLPPAPEPPEGFRFALLNNAVANSTLGRLAKPKATPRPMPMTEGYVVADASVAVDERLVARSEAEARELLREVRRRDPRRRLDVEVLPLSDVLR
jgi:hypothetical protein